MPEEWRRNKPAGPDEGCGDPTYPGPASTFRVFDLRQQLIALGSIAGAASAATAFGMLMRFLAALENGLRSVHRRARAVDRRLGVRQMAFADRDTVEGALGQFRRGRKRLGLGPEVVFEILPVVAALIIRAERAAGIVAAMDHAILAA